MTRETKKEVWHVFIATVDYGGRVQIPAEVRRYYNINRGEQLKVRWSR